MKPERIFSAYLVLQAAVGVGFWLSLAYSPRVRSVIELLPAHRSVTNSFVFADMVVGVAGSLLAAWAISQSRRWAAPMIAFTAGGLVYPTLYLVWWAAFAKAGSACLAIMIPPTTLTCFITFQTYTADRRADRAGASQLSGR